MSLALTLALMLTAAVPEAVPAPRRPVVTALARVSVEIIRAERALPAALPGETQRQLRRDRRGAVIEFE